MTFGTIGGGSLTPAAPAPAAPWIESGADSLVPTYMASAETLAQTSQTAALAAIGALGNFSVTLPLLTMPSIPIPSITLPTVGTAPTEPTGLTATFPLAPTEPSIGTLTPVVIGDAPTFDAAAPLLISIPLPNPFSALVPTAPNLSLVSIPVEPNFVFPSVPTLAGLNLPNVPTLDIPLFTDTLGNSPTAPNATFTWAEVDYQTSLLTSMNSRLLEFVGGASTGLSPAVESAIWNRARDRQNLVTQGAVQEASRLFASRGFTIPGGSLLRVVQQALQEGANQDAEMNRTVMIKQAELEQSNFQFSFNLAMQLESRLIEHFNQVQNRAFEAEKFTFQAVIQIFNAQVQLYQADVQAFGAKAEVFKTRLQAVLSRLEIYKAELEGQKTLSEVNKNQVQVYTAQIDAVKALADVYKTRVEAVKVQIEADKVKAEIYKAQLSGYETQVKAKTAEYQGYATQIEAEVSKVKIYSEQASVFKSRADAFGTLVSAKLSEQNLNFKQLQEFPLELLKQRNLSYQIGIQAEAERLKALVSVYDTKVKSFATLEGAKSDHTKAEVEVIKATTAVYTSQASLAIQAGEANLRAATSSGETAQTSLRAAGQITGQLAAAALSARSVHASITSGTNNSSSNSAQNSSGNTAHVSAGTSDTTATNRTDHTSTSTSTGNSTNTNHNYNYKV